MSKAELNYTVTKKENLDFFHSLNKFRHYFPTYHAFVHTNHKTIKFLMKKPHVNYRTIRWLLLLQWFDLIIIDKLGK